MTEPGKNEVKGEGVSGVAGPSVVVHHDSQIAPSVKVFKLNQMHYEQNVDFPVDADESSKQGGTAVGIIKETDG